MKTWHKWTYFFYFNFLIYREWIFRCHQFCLLQSTTQDLVHTSWEYESWNYCQCALCTWEGKRKKKKERWVWMRCGTEKKIVHSDAIPGATPWVEMQRQCGQSRKCTVCIEEDVCAVMRTNWFVLARTWSLCLGTWCGRGSVWS